MEIKMLSLFDNMRKKVAVWFSDPTNIAAAATYHLRRKIDAMGSLSNSPNIAAAAT